MLVEGLVTFCYAPEPMKYPIDRFTMETKRQLDLLDKILAQRSYIAGDTYTIANIRYGLGTGIQL